MRTKKRNAVDSSILKKAWDNAFKQQESESIDALRKDGWIPSVEIAEKIGVCAATAKKRFEIFVKNGKFEKKNLQG